MSQYIFKSVTVILFLVNSICIAGYEPATEQTKAIKRFQDAKIGVCAIAYIILPSPENNLKEPIAWDAEYNVPILKEAGIGYIYFCAKEGDGPCFWESEYTDSDEKLVEKYGETARK